MRARVIDRLPAAGDRVIPSPASLHAEANAAAAKRLAQSLAPIRPIAVHRSLATVHERGQLRHIGLRRVGRRQTMDQSARIRPHVHLHPEIPGIPVPGLSHLGVARLRRILRRAGSRDDRGIDDRARLQQEPLVRQQVADAWRTGLNLTWVKTRILDNRGLDPTAYPNGGSLPCVPRVAGSAFVSGEFSRTVTAVARVTLVGRQTVFTERFFGPRMTLDAYAPLDLGVQWHAGGALDLYTRVTNVLDTTYEAAFDKPGNPRAAVVGVRTGF